MILHQEDIKKLDQRYRTTFINSLAGFRQAVLIGTKSLEGNANLAIFNSLIHIGASPALYGFICRPDTANKDTLKNILDTQQYTLNYIHTIDLEKAHQTSAKYERGVSEFEAVGFTQQYLKNFGAPFVHEAVVKIAMKLEEKTDIKSNGTILVIGSLQHIELDGAIVTTDGFVALDQADVLACTGLDAYYSMQPLGRLTYAKPGKWPEAIYSPSTIEK